MNDKFHKTIIDWLINECNVIIVTRRDGGYFISDVCDYSNEEEESPFDNFILRVINPNYYNSIHGAIFEYIDFIYNEK